MWQGDPALGQPSGLLQLLCAIPPELPAQRVAHPGCLTVKRQPGAPRSRGAGGGGGRRCHRLPGFHVAVLALVLLQPFLSASPLSPPAPPVEAAAGRSGLGGLDFGLILRSQRLLGSRKAAAADESSQSQKSCQTVLEQGTELPPVLGKSVSQLCAEIQIRERGFSCRKK